MRNGCLVVPWHCEANQGGILNPSQHYSVFVLRAAWVEVSVIVCKVLARPVWADTSTKKSFSCGKLGCTMCYWVRCVLLALCVELSSNGCLVLPLTDVGVFKFETGHV